MEGFFLGGDAQIELTYRQANAQELAWMARQSRAQSQIIDFCSMAVAPGTSKRILTQVKAVDSAYPLVGAVTLSGDMGLSEAFAGQDGLPGAILAPALLRRLNINLGDQVKFGQKLFVVMATLLKEPDNFGKFRFGPPQPCLDQRPRRLRAPGRGHPFFEQIPPAVRGWE